ncbi:MAG: hypothetical protein H0X27_00075 [Caulobacteraceae bacterium]|nr:hypothetical protein [Caulobacteraceae bacterium]
MRSLGNRMSADHAATAGEMNMDRTEAQALIEDAAKEFDNGLGWSLLYCPWANLSKSEVALITLNPAGHERSTGVSVEEGSAFVHQDWLGKGVGRESLQLQVKQLCDIAAVDPDEMLAGCLVPFRSPSWAELPRREEALRFGVSLWRKLLGDRRPRLTFTLGDVAYQQIHAIFGAGATKMAPSGWGKIYISASDYPGGRLVGLPHLSHYKLFSDNSPGLERRKILEEILSA